MTTDQLSELYDLTVTARRAWAELQGKKEAGK